MANTNRKGVEWRPKWEGTELARYESYRREFLDSAGLFRSLRKDLRLTQVQAAAALDTSQANVSKAERRSTVDMATVQKLAAAAGATVALVVTTADGRTLEYST